MSSTGSLQPQPLQGTATPAPAVPPVPPLADAPRQWWRPTPSKFWFVVFVLTLVALTIVFLYPLVWTISASLKPQPEVFDNRLIPRTFHPHNYVEVFTGIPGITTGAPFGRWFWNSMYLGVLAAAAVTVSSALVAFGFAYFRFPMRNFLFGLVLATMMLPGAVTMIPTYLIFNHLHLTGTQYPLWIPNLFGSAFYIFLMRQFFLGIPRELFEAARIDGDNFFTMFWRMAVPLAKPALIVSFIFEFKASWTDLTKPLIYLNKDSQFTIPRGLFTLMSQLNPQNGGHGDYQVALAALVISVVPMIILFLAGQRYFIEGIATQGRKG
jgi:multiple sugar transport system permease protein